jgi:O-methyltransferase involved in polyketide biosynthesis
MDVEKVRLPSEDEPYLFTMYGKALDSRVENSILGDTFVDAAVRRVDFDFARLKFPKDGAITLPIRALHLDGWTREFLASRPTANVLHLGCGLDSRVYRIDPPSTVHWVDVDRPEVIELRRRLYPERANYEMIAASVTDPTWLASIGADRPLLVVAEGLLCYLPPEEGIALFRRISATFPSGEFAFDVYSRTMTRLVSFAPRLRRAGISIPWGINDSHELEQQVPRLHLVEEVPFLTMPALVARLSRTRVERLTWRMLVRSGFVRSLIRHVRYRF